MAIRETRKDMSSLNHLSQKQQQQSKKRRRVGGTSHDEGQQQEEGGEQRRQPRLASHEVDDMSTRDEEQTLMELRKALEVLQRCRENSSSSTTDTATAAGSAPLNSNIHVNDKEAEYIPGMVNRILTESRNGRGCKRTVAMTDMLVTLVLDFVEPYVLQVVRERDKAPARHSVGGDGRNGDTTKGYAAQYRDRSITWAVHCIRDLLRPIDTKGNIPELDALLSASGSFDGLAHERNVQQRLVESLEGMQPKLTSAAAAAAAEDPNGADLTDILALLEKRRAVSGDGVGRNIPSTIVSPEEWLKEIQMAGDAGMRKEADDTTESFPFLGQMRDFMTRHKETSPRDM
eukprot:CAMPEP_0178479838 /NCGR_PEP_ID=MMETSP0696-20121128/5386_1 /TAXON_ID=265572 /ORGANISM="Extubocellulus spinifer, Strain CCMP396" /LENGTH=344 /DNA_ID=CAMNT_0020107259 /DNA_START=31 /DNA_END=1065 /DNA_ORIENTATION=+